MLMRSFASLVLACLVALPLWAAPMAVYVAPNGDDAAAGTSPDRPIASLARARDVVRQLKAKGLPEGGATVYLKGGVYPMTEPVLFAPEDSGTSAAPIVYMAAPGEKPVLHGGRAITGWRKHNDTIWVADVPEVKAGKWSFNQLFINGELRQRARFPNEGFYRVTGFPDGGREVDYHTDSQRFEYAEGHLNPKWHNLDDVNVIVYHFWTDSHLPIQSIDTEKRIVTFKHKAGKVFTDDFTAGGARYIVENVFEGLDQPGDWYLDRKAGLIYYIPVAGEEMSKAQVIAPFAPAFILMQGNAKQRQFVEHISFRGLGFMYSRFELPPGNSNDRQGSASVSAAIRLNAARHITFDRCDIRNLGTFAFELGRGCSENRFTHNQITRIAAGGFRMDGGADRDHPLERTGNNLIADNEIGYYGEVYPSAVGILLQNTAGNIIAHNHIHHGWYTGISLGWVWGYQRSISRDNVVEFNHIHDIGQGLLSDMGGIYTLGLSPGTVLRNNLIHHVEANLYGGWGIYLDEGSSHLLVEDNIVYKTKFAPFNIHFSKEAMVRNNIFALGRLEQLSRTRVEPHKSLFFENNIVYWTEGELLSKNWKDVPYQFHFHSKDKTGTKEVTSTFEFNWNLYFNPGQPLQTIKFNGQTWAEWQKRGKDTNSRYADPLFVDAAGFDFRLKPQSPAFEMGFKAIDMSTVGPRK